MNKFFEVNLKGEKMDIKIIILGVAVLLFMISLSGCEQQSGTSDNIRLNNYDIATLYWRSDEYHHYNEVDGFFHDFESNAYGEQYLIVGNITNVGTDDINSMTIRFLFYLI